MKKLISIFVFIMSLSTVIYAEQFQSTFIDAYIFDTANETKTSSSSPTGGYYRFNLLNDINATGDTSAMSLKIELFVSHDDTTYYLVNDAGRFNKSVTYTTVDVIETFPIDINGYNFIKVKATSAGCDTSANYYTTTVKGIFKK